MCSTGRFAGPACLPEPGRGFAATPGPGFRGFLGLHRSPNGPIPTRSTSPMCGRPPACAAEFAALGQTGRATRWRRPRWAARRRVPAGHRSPVAGSSNAPKRRDPVPRCLRGNGSAGHQPRKVGPKAAAQRVVPAGAAVGGGPDPRRAATAVSLGHPECGQPGRASRGGHRLARPNRPHSGCRPFWGRPARSVKSPRLLTCVPRPPGRWQSCVVGLSLIALPLAGRRLPAWLPG
jgi:hypothetical protein